MSTWAKQTGFTIVELLIVIVVIGILAAITVVAYNGIQTRAENAKTTNAVGEYVKAILSYQSINGIYPVDPGWPCLGGYPGTNCGAVTGGSCLGTGSTSSQPGFDTLMKQVFSGAVPQPSSQVMVCGAAIMSGAYYSPSVGKTAEIIYFLRGNQSCGGIGGIQSYFITQQDDTTRCNTFLPTLP